MTDSIGNPDREFYLIQNQGYEFHTGHLLDGRQLLVGCLAHDSLTGLFFDPQGNFITHVIRPMPTEPSTVGLGMYDPVVIQKESDALKDWWSELGFTPGTIKVRRFDSKETGVRIEELPEYIQDFLADPEHSSLNDQERKDVLDQLHKWRAEGQFVLWWGKDYWMDANGEVEST